MMKKYFLLKEDYNVENRVKFKDFTTSKKAIFLKEDVEILRDMADMYIDSDENTIFPALIESPVLMISEELYDLFNLYEENITYKIVVFSDIKREIQKVYRLMVPEVIDGLSEKTTYTKSNWLDNMVLDKNKVGDNNIFRIKAALDYYLVVSLDVAEAILKRDFQGIIFKEVEVV